MKGRTMKILAGLGAAAVAAGSAFQLTRLNYEEPAYEELESPGPFELRRYEPRVVAETTVAGGESEVTSEGFRRLAGYIFGGNSGEHSIAMTTPVERAPSDGARIDMTTPVERRPGDDGWVIRFTMPRDRTMDALPLPEDPRVTFERVPSKTVAVLRFSGRVTVEERRARTRELEAQLQTHGLRAIGEPTLAQYDPPWVLGVFRRNEIHLEVQGPPSGGSIPRATFDPPTAGPTEPGGEPPC